MTALNPLSAISSLWHPPRGRPYLLQQAMLLHYANIILTSTARLLSRPSTAIPMISVSGIGTPWRLGLPVDR
jgi:hypothetical protein